jgi:GTPase SAR1 family protein
MLEKPSQNAPELDGTSGVSASPEVEQVAAESRPQDLISYKRTELGCVTDLRRLLDLAVKSGITQSILDLTQDVLKRTENKCFSLAVVGEFKRGKSTFINALLGREILPADIRPCSATLNRVTYGLRPKVSIYFKAQGDRPRRVEEIGIDQLETYVTKLTPEAKNNAAQIDEAVIHYPTEYCRHNVDIIDTPGLNDDQTMTSVTMSVIPKVDAAILVIMPESPFSGFEGDFLTKHLLLQDLGRVMFVVNAIDRLRKPKDRERIVEIIKARITEAVEARLTEQFAPGSEDFQRYRQQIGQPTVFPLSAYLALEAQKDGDDKLLEESQFTAFTTALEQFLTHTRGAIELQVLSNRILATGDEILKKINIEVGALSMGQQEFQAAYESSLAQLESLRRRRDMEIGKIDDAAARTWQRLEPMVLRVGDDLKRDADAVIDNAGITAADLTKDKLPDLTERLSARVSEAVRIRGQRLGEALQIELERDLQSELERLHDFAATVGSTLQGIEGRFDTVQMDGSVKNTAGGESLAAAVSVFTGFGGIWSGYREAGFKGAALGGAASVGTLFVGGVLAGLLTLPISLPLVIGLSIISIFTGGWAAKRVFGGDRVERFTEQYREAIRGRIDAELEERDLPRGVKDNVAEVYAAVKAKLIGEVTASIEQTQSTLDDLRSRKARDEVLTEHRRQELEETRQEVVAIRAKALRLSNQLAEVVNV